MLPSDFVNKKVLDDANSWVDLLQGDYLYVEILILHFFGFACILGL